MGCRQCTWVGLLRLLALVLLASSFLVARPALAEPKTRAEALKLAGEAMDLYEAGDFGAALDGFTKAHELVPAPTLKLRMARCLDQLDRMQEAVEQYREVIAYELTGSSPKVHREAREQAVPELSALLEEMPSITVIVRGPGAKEATVTMGGEPLSAEFLGQKRPLDPGGYAFEAISGDLVTRQDVTLQRAQALDVTLELAPDTSGDGRAESDGPLWQILGWTAIGVGGAGLVLGAVAGVMVLNQEQDLEERCTDRQCPPDARDDVESFDTMRTLTTAGFVIGGIGLAAGTALLLLAPSDDQEADQAHWVPYVTLGGGGIRGTF
jgi:hypothetical protein